MSPPIPQKFKIPSENTINTSTHKPEHLEEMDKFLDTPKTEPGISQISE